MNFAFVIFILVASIEQKTKIGRLCIKKNSFYSFRCVIRVCARAFVMEQMACELNFSQYKWRKEGIVRYRDRVMQDKIQKREGNRRLKVAASFSTLASNLFDLFRFFSFPFCCFI